MSFHIHFEAIHASSFAVPVYTCPQTSETRIMVSKDVYYNGCYLTLHRNTPMVCSNNAYFEMRMSLTYLHIHEIEPAIFTYS